MRRRTRWALAAGGAVVALVLGLCLYGGWRPFGAGPDPLSAIPEDVDAACRIDVTSVRASPLFADPAVAAAIASAFGLPDGASLGDPMLGDEAAIATRDGSWLAALRVAGPAHAARLGAARLFVKTTGDGPVVEATLPDGDLVYLARAPGLWIASDDEDLAAEALATLSGEFASILSAEEVRGAFDEPATLTAWASEDASSYAVDAAREALGDAAAGIAGSLPEPDSAFTLRLTAAPDASRCHAALAWRGSPDREMKLSFTADLGGIATAIEDAAEKAPPGKPRIEASDRVRLTIDVSKEGLSGEPLRAEVDRRIAAAAASRVAGDAAAAREAAHRRADLLRALARLDGNLVIHDGDVRLTLTLGR